MATLNQFGPNIQITENFSGSRSKRGLWAGDQEYYIKAANLLDLIPANGSAHPVFNWIYLEDADIKGEEGGWVQVMCKYAGIAGGWDSDDEADSAEFSLGVVTSEEPLEVHDRYFGVLAITEIQIASKLAKDPPVDGDNKPIAVDTAGWPALQIELYDYLRRGRETFKDPKATWTRRWVSSTRPDNLDKVGTIEIPPGDPPPSAPGRNWLSDGLRSEERGVVFDNEQVWIESGRGGWDVIHYS